MTDAEVESIYRTAETEFNANEQAMLITPLAVLGLIERLRSCERARAESESYDQLSDG